MMKTISDKMICPNCRVEMNHHCDKLVYASLAWTKASAESWKSSTPVRSVPALHPALPGA